MGLRIKILFIVMFLMSPISMVEAAWEGPVDVISRAWGSSTGQFGLRSGDSGDTFPLLTVITPDGRIVVTDSVNKKQLVFSVQGSFIKDVQWIIKSKESGRTVYDVPEYSFGPVVGFSADGNIYTVSGDKYFIVSPTGQLIKTSAERPLELGRISEKMLGAGNYKITIAYPDTAYVLPLRGSYERYIRDNSGNINPVAGKEVRKFTRCGKELGVLLIPKDDIRIDRPGGGGQEADFTYLAQYGEPIVAPNGDVYVWKRTPTNYSILKWTWVADPNVPSGPDAPSGLTVTPSTKGLYLTWTASPGDPGCVASYEISRATSAGGAGTTVGTVPAGTMTYNDSSAVAGTTYYYKVRAKAGSEYSPYTDEVSGKK